MKSFERVKKLLGMSRLKPGSVVSNEIDGSPICSALFANIDPGHLLF